VHPDGHHLHSIKKQGSGWGRTDEPYSLLIPQKCEIILTSNKRFIVLYGGRGSGKSVVGVDISIIGARDDQDKTFCLREYYSSIKTSIYSQIKDEVERLEFDGFDIKSTFIRFNGKDVFEFGGLSKNGSNIRSSFGFKRFVVEESQFISVQSMLDLTPTARKKPQKGLPGAALEEDDALKGVSILFIANPGSAADPFSQRFIVPFQDKLDKNGVYEDDLHLIVKMNYTDNPWYKDSGLEVERQWDYKHRSRAMYDHIWLAAFNDSVEDALIMSEWFDACIDAHIKLGFEARGSKIAAHDPADSVDDKTLAIRHGSVVTHLYKKSDGDVNEACDWATGLAINHGVDLFNFDGDGLGAALNRQIAEAFILKLTDVAMFRGSEEPDFPDAIYAYTDKHPVKDQKTNKDALRNKRAQYYAQLAWSCFLTYRAVIFGDEFDPDDLISFSSDMELLSELRSELCRMPKKPNRNGFIELYTKAEMKGPKFKFKSPNLGDAVMMSGRCVNIEEFDVQSVMPRDITTMRLGK